MSIYIAHFSKSYSSVSAAAFKWGSPSFTTLPASENCSSGKSLNSRSLNFLGGLSLHLNHLIAYRLANYNWPFWTLPFGLFGSNLDTRDLETYPRTYSGHF